MNVDIEIFDSIEAFKFKYPQQLYKIISHTLHSHIGDLKYRPGNVHVDLLPFQATEACSPGGFYCVDAKTILSNPALYSQYGSDIYLVTPEKEYNEHKHQDCQIAVEKYDNGDLLFKCHSIHISYVGIQFFDWVYNNVKNIEIVHLLPTSILDKFIKILNYHVHETKAINMLLEITKMHDTNALYRLFPSNLDNPQILEWALKYPCNLQYIKQTPKLITDYINNNTLSTLILSIPYITIYDNCVVDAISGKLNYCTMENLNKIFIDAQPELRNEVLKQLAI